MNIGSLIIFSGLPGTGKSTLATGLAMRIHATYLRIDTIEQGLRDVCGISQIDGKGYQLTHLIAQENLRLGNLVIADSVNPWSLTRKAWNNVAEEIKANFVNIEVVCSDKQEHRRRIESRGSSVPGLKLPTWKEVVERDYHEWDRDRVLLDTCGKSVEAALGELVSILEERGIEK